MGQKKRKAMRKLGQTHTSHFKLAQYQDLLIGRPRDLSWETKQILRELSQPYSEPPLKLDLNAGMRRLIQQIGGES